MRTHHLAIALVSLAACSHAATNVPTPSPVAKAEPPPAAAPAPAPAAVPCAACAVPLPPLAAIHFGFDDTTLHAEDLVIVNAIGDYLQGVATASLTIAGHCDERGTIEYNIALGDRRAEAARQYLVRLGVDAARMKTISYGSASPLDPGHNESAWARNRRAEFQIELAKRAGR